MGLTIYYSMVTSLTEARQVRRLAETLRQFALDLPFQRVSGLVELGGEGKESDEVTATTLRWLQIQATESVGDCLVEPLHGIGFATLPGQGCESANFAFCRYPAYVSRESKGGREEVPTGLEGWRWASFCKTQYASDPRFGGIENFLRCHLSVIHLLDFAKRTGRVTLEVRDEGHYWESRDLERLAKAVGEWNEMVAGVVSALRPALERHGKVEASITRFPNYERLEARGLEKLAALRKSLEGEE